MREIIRRVVLKSRQRTYSHLLGALTPYRVVYPFLPVQTRFARVDDCLLVLVLFASLCNIAGGRRHLIVGLVLGFPAIASRLVTAHLGVVAIAPETAAARSVSGLVASLISSAIKDVPLGRRSTGERIMGAIVAYLLIGLQWSLTYGYIEHVDPGSFSIPADMLAQGSARSSATPVSIFASYSIVTLATLGYGDITPISAAARPFALFEAVVGQLDDAVTIARLVGIRSPSARRRHRTRRVLTTDGAGRAPAAWPPEGAPFESGSCIMSPGPLEVSS